MIHFEPRERALALSLATVAGFVDASGFLMSNGLFVSFMSGNTTRLGVAVADWSGSIGPAIGIIAAFIAGVASATAFGRSRWNGQARMLAGVSIILALSAVLVFTGKVFPSVMAMAFAMGSINIVLSDANGVRVGLTYVTGALIKVGEALGGRCDDAPSVYWSAALWLALLMGCIMGAKASAVFGPYAIWIAAGSVAALSLLHASLGRRGSGFQG